jgi:hypothetical protein
MSTLTIRVISEGDYTRCQVDDRTILVVKHPYDQTFDVEVPSAGKFLLSYFIHGSEGDKYSIQILSPIQKEQHGKLGAEGKEFGLLRIDLSNI